MQQGQDFGTSLTPVSTLGEFGLIERLTKGFPSHREQVLKGVGDDAAVIYTGQGRVQVLSTDLLLEGVHFDLSYVPLRHLGYKAVAVNVSDVVAMNAEPYGVTVSVAMSNRFSVEAMDELYAGIQLACEKYKLELLGGDTTSSGQGLIISVSAYGEAHRDEVVYRNGAQANDLLCVSGDLGGAYAGLLVLDREKAVYLNTQDIQPDLTDYDYVIGRQLKPEPRLDMILKLQELGLRPTSMIDISDGLASEIHHLCRQSKVGASIYAHKLPLDYQTVKVAEEFKIAPATFALNGGEDYELLFTLPISSFDKIKDVAEISIIGKMTDDPQLVQIVLESGSVADIQAQGWEHFSEETPVDNPESTDQPE